MELKETLKDLNRTDGSLQPANKENKGFQVIDTSSQNLGNPSGYVTKENLAQIIREELANILLGADQGMSGVKIPSFNGSNVMGSVTKDNLSIILGVTKRYEFVDMGLPSGTLWASKNLGAETITDYGAYFSWGNVKGQKPTGTTFSTGFGSSNEGEPYASSEGAALTGDIPLSQDAANYYLGGVAKMPTNTQFAELFNSSYTTNEWTTYHGVAGSLVTSKINGNKLFFPATGNGYGTSLNNAGSIGYYWSRSLHSSADGYYLRFDSSDVDPQRNNTRFLGFSARAVL